MGDQFGAYGYSTPTSTAWVGANRAYYIPFYMPQTSTVYRLWTLNGATAGGTNSRDIGIYSADTSRLPATKLVASGATASSGTNALQFYDITDTVLAQGLYFIGVAQNGTTDTMFANTPASALSLDKIVFMQETAYTLPASATPALMTALYLPVCGLALRASV